MKFSSIKPNPDSDYDFASSRPQQHDTLNATLEQAEKKKAIIRGPPSSELRQIQGRKIALSDPSCALVKEKEDANISRQSLAKPEKIKMCAKDFPMS